MDNGAFARARTLGSRLALVLVLGVNNCLFAFGTLLFPLFAFLLQNVAKSCADVHQQGVLLALFFVVGAHVVRKPRKGRNDKRSVVWIRWCVDAHG